MAFKITLEVYVTESATFPLIAVESHKLASMVMRENLAQPDDSVADAAALERVLTEVREFAESLTRGVVETGCG